MTSFASWNTTSPSSLPCWVDLGIVSFSSMAACGEKKASEPCVHQEHLDVLLKDNERHRLENIKLKSLCESLQARLDGAEAQLIAERQFSNSLLKLERKRARRLERTISALREKLERLSFRLLLRKPKAKRAIQCDIELPDARTEEIEAHLLSFDAQLRAFKEKVSAHEVESRAKEEQLAAQGADLRAKGEQLAAHDGLELPEADIEARLSAFGLSQLSLCLVCYRRGVLMFMLAVYTNTGGHTTVQFSV